jgi:hypothetical protein
MTALRCLITAIAFGSAYIISQFAGLLVGGHLVKPWWAALITSLGISITCLGITFLERTR